MEIMIQLLVGERLGGLMVGIVETYSAEICKMTLQNVLRYIKAQKRIVLGHCEIAWGVVSAKLCFEVCCQYFVELRIQHFNGAGFSAWKLLLQGNCVFEFSNLLQDAYNL